MQVDNFTAKVLLFGEYSIIFGSMGLSIPFDLFQGHLSFPSNAVSAERVLASNLELRKLYEHMLALVEQKKLQHSFDLNSLKFEIEEGLYFDSSIPEGAGLGSSGAICAAVFHRYVQHPLSELELLKNDLAQMEALFHGASSGLDPLVCLRQTPLLIQGSERLLELEQRFLFDEQKKIHLFLLSSSTRRKTGPLVTCYLKKSQDQVFQKMQSEQLIPGCNSCIEACLRDDGTSLWSTFATLSALQLEHFSEMIPSSLKNGWKGPHFNLKLCGAGGGGFFLGITDDLEKMRSQKWFERAKLLASFSS